VNPRVVQVEDELGVGSRLALAIFMIFFLLRTDMVIAKESFAGIIAENDRIASWPLDSSIAGLAAGTVITFSDGSYADVPAGAGMPWFTSNSFQASAADSTQTTALRDELLSVASAHSPSLTGSGNSYHFAYADKLSFAGGNNVYTQNFFYSSNLGI
jgi:hypothetical protein